MYSTQYSIKHAWQQQCFLVKYCNKDCSETDFYCLDFYKLMFPIIANTSVYLSGSQVYMPCKIEYNNTPFFQFSSIKI